jgi:hypothetical protein
VTTLDYETIGEHHQYGRRRHRHAVNTPPHERPADEPVGRSGETHDLDFTAAGEDR